MSEAAPPSPTMTMTAALPPGEVSANLADLAAQARAYVAAGRAESTRRAYGHDWDRYARWCASQGLQALPTAPESLALYLSHLARQGRKVAGIQRAVAAISQAHKAAGHESPRNAAVVKAVLAGIRRTHGVAQAQKAALSVAELRQMSRALPDNLAGLRDRAVLLVGFAGAFRRSELVALDVGDLTFTDDGVEALLRRSKTDQEAAGRKIGIPFGSDPLTCPVRALKRWLATAGVESGAVFRAVNKGGGLASRKHGWAPEFARRSAHREACSLVSKSGCDQIVWTQPAGGLGDRGGEVWKARARNHEANRAQICGHGEKVHTGRPAL